MTRGVFADRDPQSLAYDIKTGVTSIDMHKRKMSLTDHPKGRWLREGVPLDLRVSDTLEKCYLAGEMKCGVWDNGLFRDFDLAKMQEIPGLKELRRVAAPRDKRQTSDISDVNAYADPTLL